MKVICISEKYAISIGVCPSAIPQIGSIYIVVRTVRLPGYIVYELMEMRDRILYDSVNFAIIPDSEEEITKEKTHELESVV